MKNDKYESGIKNWEGRIYAKPLQGECRGLV